MVYCENKTINIRGKPSVTNTRNFNLEREIDFRVEFIEGSIVDIDYELEQIKHIQNLKAEQRKRIAKLQDSFYRLFHQTIGINGDNIRRRQQPLECC